MKADRLHRMEQYITEREYVSLDMLCDVFGVSKNTVRRDVGELIRLGGFQKVHGGVGVIRQESASLIAYGDRDGKNVEAKAAICAMAARFIHDGDVIYIDSGSTVTGLVEHIARRAGVTVLTNNLQVILRCMEHPGINIIAPGGQLNRSTASFSSNFCALENLGRFNIRSVFMAATGVSIEKGATHTSPEELEIKREIVARGDTRYLLADSTKFGHSALLTYAELRDFDCVITERRPEPAYLEHFEAHNIRLVSK